MPIKRARSLIRATPTQIQAAEIPSFTVQHDMSDEPTQLLDNEGEYVHDTDADDGQMLVDRIPQTSSSSATGTSAPIASGNSVTAIRAPIALGNLVENTMAPIALGNSVTNTAPIVSGNLVTNTAPLIAVAQDRETGILQMGNVIQNEPLNTKRAEEQPRRSVFNMSKAVILSDTVDERLAKAFLVQARDPTFDGHMDLAWLKAGVRRNWRC